MAVAGDGRNASLARQALARSRNSCGRLTMMMSHALGGQIAVVHALCAVFARSAAVLVDALGLALPAADAGAAGPQGRAADDGRHGEGKKSNVARQMKILGGIRRCSGDRSGGRWERCKEEVERARRRER